MTEEKSLADHRKTCDGCNTVSADLTPIGESPGGAPYAALCSECLATTYELRAALDTYAARALRATKATVDRRVLLETTALLEGFAIDTIEPDEIEDEPPYTTHHVGVA